MSWFERHLNWSLFLAIVVIPGIALGIFFAISLMIFYGGWSSLHASGAGEAAIESYLLTSALPFTIISFVLPLGIIAWDIIATLWYLGHKARSKWFVFLLWAPFGLIILYLLENQAVGYGGDIGYEPATAGFSDGGGYGGSGGYDERQLKELDYTPSQNVLDISGGPPARDAGSTRDAPDIDAGGADESTGEEAPPAEATERPVTYERPSMPILLGDDGNVISCGYHPGADAVNLCSRCHQYVCMECNYVTGTHPICRNCWERKTEVPLAPPSQKQVRPVPPKPAETQSVEEPDMRLEKGEPIPAEPALSSAAEVAEPVEQATAEPAVPVKQEEPVPAESEVSPVAEVAEPVEEIAAEPASQPVAESEEPPVEAAVKPEEQPDIAAVKPEEPAILTPIKPSKQDAETVKWQQEFMAIYQQAAPLISVIIKKGADGMPGSPLDLMEGLKLRPMLTLVKKLSKPKDRELRDVKSDLEQVISSSIKVADSAADFVGGGGHAMLGGPGFKRIVEGIEKASGLMEKLSQRLPAFSRPEE